MLRLTCPYCGERDHSEFTYVIEADLERPQPGQPLEDWQAYVYDRKNPRGPHHEIWQHTGGCRGFVRVTRNTLTHELYACAAPHAAKTEA